MSQFHALGRLDRPEALFGLAADATWANLAPTSVKNRVTENRRRSSKIIPGTPFIFRLRKR